MNRLMIALFALGATVLVALPAEAQQLARVYSPETVTYMPSTTDFGYGSTPLYRSSFYAAPVTTYYAPTTKEIRACLAGQRTPASPKPQKACTNEERILGLCGG